MIDLTLSLRNPWLKKFASIKNYYRSVTKNKTIELQFLKTNDILYFNFSMRYRQSHAGIELGIGLLSYMARVQLSDNRHWDYYNNCWEKK